MGFHTKKWFSGTSTTGGCGAPLVNESTISKSYFSIKVEMLRSFFEKNVDDTIRRIWREVMTNELMKTYTWSGTPKPNSGKEKGLAVKGSRLLSAVIEAVKFGDLSKTPIRSIEQISKMFIRKAVDRLKHNAVALHKLST